jgi:ATP-dependent Lon protease
MTNPNVLGILAKGRAAFTTHVWRDFLIRSIGLVRAMDDVRSGAGLGLPLMVALVGGLLDRNTRGSTIVVGSLNLGGSVEMIPNAVAIAELAVEKQAKVLLMPVSARRGLNDLPDDLAIKISIEFYKDPEDAVFKGLED